MNIIAVLLTAFENLFGKSGLGATIVSFPGVLAAGLVQFVEDEAKIFGDAVSTLVTDLKAGKPWDQAWSDVANKFYGEEVGEGDKVALAVLEWIAKTFSGVAAAGA